MSEKIKVIELFSGTESFSETAESFEMEVFTIDNNKKFNPSLCKDILNVTKEDIPFIPNIIWASPPCTEYSHAKRRGVRNIEEANKLVLRTLEIINWYPNCKWFLENPQTGLLKNQPFMNELFYRDVSYCKYGMPYRKQTRIWTNFKEWIPQPICKKDCKFMDVTGKKHIDSIGNGRRIYTTKSYSTKDKYKIPIKLCLEILRSVPYE